MARQTIDFGIDLGTTNSSIASLEKNGPIVFRNNEGDQITPSAVYIDKKGAMRVGEAAKERLVSEPNDAASEFKLWMGTEQRKSFARANRVFSPEELSAEVLKSLRQDVKRATGEDVEAAVITVPAAFDAPQSNATERAARLAGIRVSPLLQEPIAAALAYGFQSDRENVFWLVYDFGGGTFDAAVVHVRDGLIQVVNHGGDNDLGGKLIDWAIVEQLFIPSLVREHRLADFNRSNPKWLSAFAKLKHWAEKAKIALSKDSSFDLPEEFICISDDGTPVQFECNITRGQLENLLRPYVARTINICRRVLAEKKLGAADVERVLLVGGPTYTPYLRQVLPDSKEGLGIPIEFGIDPLTVVAHGAALFAGGQKVPKTSKTFETGSYGLELEYKPIGAETEPLVGGRVSSAEKKNLSGFSVKFTNAEARPPWDSGNIALHADGTFMVTLWADKQHQNTFTIELFDDTGKKCKITPHSMTYTVGLVITNPPLTHTIGIAMANNEMDVIFEKGTPLPAKSKLHSHQTVVAVRRGSAGESIRIPLVEGDHRDAADLNRRIGEFSLDLSEVNRDLPLGTEIEIKVAIDASRLLKGSMYIPLLDKEFPLKVDLVRREPSAEGLRKEFSAAKERLRTVQEGSPESNDSQTRAILKDLGDENTVASIEAFLSRGIEGQDALTCENQLLQLRQTLHRLEVKSRIPRLLVDAKNEIQWAQEVVEANGTQEETQQYQELRRELENAMAGDTLLLERRVEKLFQFRIRILMRTPEYWVGFKEYLAERLDAMTDQSQAHLWLSHAEKAIRANDLEALRSACTQLRSLLPVTGEFGGYGGTTLRSRR
jgi:molecular chaperone DnaK